MLSSSTRTVVSSQLKRVARNHAAAATKATGHYNGSGRCRFHDGSQAPLFGAAPFSSGPHPSASGEAQPAFSSYEYPTRTEAPEITTTLASETETGKAKPKERRKVYHPTMDPFDDAGSLSEEDRARSREEHAEAMDSIEMSSFPIGLAAPDFVPPNVPSGELEVPETLVTTLDNGIRVVSQETYSQMCTIGVLSSVGSRHEEVEGTMHLLETMAFGSTEKYQGPEITQMLQDWGATRFVSHSREQSLHCVDILRPNVEKGMELLSQVVLEPLITGAPQEVEYAKEVMAFQAQEQIPELVLGEALQVAAYGADQQLGKAHFATAESIPLLEARGVEDFYGKNIKGNPGGIVVAGAGISHDELVGMAEEHFSTMEQSHSPATLPSTYRGGHSIVEKPATESVYQPMLPEEDQCRVALAFPVGGWHSDTMVTACVLQTLLGGGSSFSAGGPGKGMYSRMYQQVLNRYGWMESAEAFTTFADEGGLFGVSASTAVPSKVPELVAILADQLASVAIHPVGDLELSRARNMLRCNVLAQLESRLILFEDMGRQVLTYGRREDAAKTCAKIEAVTAGDIQALAVDMLRNHPPTLVATGSHADRAPDYGEVSRWFR